MRRFLLFVCVLLIQGEVFPEDFGLFKNSWNTVPLNKQMTVSYSVYKTNPHPKREEIKVELERLRDLKKVAQEEPLFEPDRPTAVNWWEDKGAARPSKGDLNRALDQALEKYDNSMSSFYSSIESKFERLIEIMNSEESASETKSFRFLVRSVSFKLISTEYEDWKATLKGKKIRHCAVRVDTDLQSIALPDMVFWENFSLVFFDEDGLEVTPSYKRGEKVSPASVKLSLSTLKAGAPQTILFMPDASCGAPVRVEVQ
jgi:hypothetical protein